MVSQNPRNLDFLSHYSNLLHTLKLSDQLAFVASLAFSVERNRSETLYVIGNYFSLVSRHDQAVDAFKKVLLLDRNFSPAWTLLAHEYVHLEKPITAVDCYSQALWQERPPSPCWPRKGAQFG